MDNKTSLVNWNEKKNPLNPDNSVFYCFINENIKDYDTCPSKKNYRWNILW